MSEWPGSGRGTRTQFRLGPAGGFLRGIHPVRGDIMDVGPSAAAGLSAELVSSNKGTRTRTVREYEQTISELKKENFDLKLKIYMSEEGKYKNFRKDKDGVSHDKDNSVQVMVQLKLETESLQIELNHKDNLLQEAKNQVEKYELSVKELSQKCQELQSELALLSEVPTKDEFSLLLHEKENLLHLNNTLEKCLQEKSEEIEMANHRIEVLATANESLEAKKKKRNIVLQSFVIKDMQEKELLPDELRTFAISAVQAAKNGKKDDLVAAVKNFNAAVCQVLASSLPTRLLNSSETGNSQHKCLEEECAVEQRCLSLPNHNNATDLSGVQSFKEFISVKGTPLCPEKKSLDCFIRNSFLSGTVSESCMAEKDVSNSSQGTPVPIKRASSLVSLANGSRCSFGKESETESSPQKLLLLQNGSIQNASNLEESLKFQNVLNENMQLKQKLEANLVLVEGLRHAYEEIKSKLVSKEPKQNGAQEASCVFAALCQRDFSLFDAAAFERNGGKLSDEMAELREDTLLLLLTIEGKNKEISDVKQTLSTVQADLEQALNNNQTLLNEDCVNERNELHERLSYSCTVNMELMRHLRNLEAFMEGLLQNRLDSSLESVSDRSSFFSNVSKCLNESLKLSNVLSDHLSICEGSKLFEDSKSFQCKSQTEEKSLPDLDVSETSVPDFLAESNQGIQSHLLHLKETFGQKDFEMFYGDMLCRKCLQQLNSPLPELTGAATSRFTGYPSSESDIWSEPDRDVSMQRIGINLQVSPTSTKSPRKLRSRDQRRKLSTDHNTSSSDVQHSSRLRRNGSACRRLFGKEISKNQDFILEKYHFLISEKFSRLRSLLASVEDVQNDNLNTGVSNKINSVMTLLGETLQKLQIAKAHAKSFSPAACGKCAVLELLLDLKTFPEREDECKSSAFSQFLDEILSLKELCDEPFSLLPIGTVKVSKSIQSDPTTEQDKICELEKLLVVLKDKNGELSDNLSEVRDLIIKEKSLLETVEAENLKLAEERKHLKERVSDLQNSRNESLVQNAELVDRLTRLSEDNSEMNHILLALEQTKKESDDKLDQLADELQKNKSELVNMSIKCVALEKELNEQMKEKEKSVENFKSLQSSSSNAMEKYITEIDNLNLTKKGCTEKLEKAEEKILRLEKEIAFLNGSLNTKNNELKSLLERVELLQNSQETLSATCVELQSSLENSEAQCLSLQEKCSSHIQEASQRTVVCEEYRRQLQQAAEHFSCEKRELIDEISSLTSERDAVVQKLKFEKDSFEQLMAEKMELNEKLVESCQQIATLRSLKEKLAGDCASVLQENKYFQDTLLSSDSKCVILGRDLVQMRDTLLNLELKCVKYEKELVASAGMRKSFIDCLLNIRNAFARTGQEMLEICKSYDIGCSIESDEMSSLEFMPVIDEDNVECLCDNVSSESKKLLKTIDVILEVLKGFPVKSQEVQLVQDKYAIKIKSIGKQMVLQKREMEHLQSQNDFLKGIIEEKRKLTSDNEKLVNVGAFEIQSLKEKLHSSENEIEKGKLLLKAKDDEITNLQEHLFNLQTYINSMLLENSNGKFSNGSMKSIAENNLDSVNSFSLQLPQSSAISNSENPDLLVDDSSVSVSSTVKNSCCEKYLKKCHSLQKKLSLSRKQIQILEEEKASLREFQSSNSNLNATSKISDMESKLERKKNFIAELKGELLKACNSLIDREREVDSLKIKLSKYEAAKPKCTSPDLLRHISTEGPKAIDTNIKNLTNYKWTLIQSIFGVQRGFYEEKGIHLNYFDQFKDHVNTLFSLQLAHALSKSESLPLLSSFSTEQGCNPSDYRFKHLVGLELDIECLENLKIFLNRFFVPCVTQPATVSKTAEKVPIKSKLKVAALESEDKYSVENLIFNVSQHIDNIKDFFTIVEEFELFKSVDFASSDVGSVLLNILSEATKMQEGAEVLFKLNAVLKEMDPRRFLNKPDVSDQESVLSEETITISRSETPLSTDDLCPVKLSYSPSFKLKAQHLRTENRELVSSGKSHLLKAISSSCDSIHHRSQYSSPDLGIESDPNHEGSIPEQKNSEMSKYQKFVLNDLCAKESTTESSSKGKGNPFIDDQLYSIGTLPHFELLKREIQESLVGIKSVLSRTGDGLHHIGKHTSPRKTLESNTMKAIKDTCANIEVCLKEAYSLVGKFWTAHCPSEQEWNALVEENERLYKQLTKFKDLMQNQENEFKKAMGRLEHAQLLKASMEKKISKKLVKTKKVIRQAELKLLENRCQNCPPVPKYPFEAVQRGESSLPKN